MRTTFGEPLPRTLRAVFRGQPVMQKWAQTLRELSQEILLLARAEAPFMTELDLAEVREAMKTARKGIVRATPDAPCYCGEPECKGWLTVSEHTARQSRQSAKSPSR